MANTKQHLAAKPGINTKTIKDIIRTEKTWYSKRHDKSVRKFLFYFMDGYMGEVLWPDGGEPPYKPGDIADFRVGYRVDNVADEIEIIPAENLASAKESENQKVINMNGHPATIAMGMAKEVVVCNATGSGNTIDKDTLLNWADDIYDWLIKKRDIK